jgi:hypothetical protein
MNDHLYEDAVLSGSLDDFRLLIEGGYSVPSSLIHSAVSSCLLEQILSLLPPASRIRCLEWTDITGERAIDAAHRLGKADVVDLLKKSGSPETKKETKQDRTSSGSVMKAIELGRLYKLEPVQSMFKEKSKKKKK